MGKNKKVFPTKNIEKENKNSFQEEEMKNKEDIKIDYSNILNQSSSPFNILSPNTSYIKTDEKYNNKFDIQYPDMNYQQIDWDSRKESRYSTNDSISY